jgi:hypothetical protein
MPGLALAGGVLVAALIALLLIGGGEPDHNPMPDITGPTATRIFPGGTGGAGGSGGVAGESDGQSGANGLGGAAEAQYGTGFGRGAVLGESARREGSGSAAETQYGTGRPRGPVLGGPPGPG